MHKESTNKTVISKLGIVILTLVCATATWLPAFISPTEPLLIQSGGSLYHILFSSIHNNAALSISVCLLFLLGTIALQCWHCLQLRLVRTLSLLPALFILLLTGVLCFDHGFNPGVPAGLCIYIAFAYITNLSESDSLHQSHTMGLFIALASLFTPTFLLYLPLFIIGMYMFNKLTTTNLVGALIGICTPYILWIGCLYLTDNTYVLQNLWEQMGLAFKIAWIWQTYDIIIIAILGISLLISRVGSIRQHTDRIHPRIVSQFSFLLGLGALLLSICYHNAHHSITLILFTSLILTQYLTSNNKKQSTLFFYSFIATLLLVYGCQFIA
jgi:hypothetical protein